MYYNLVSFVADFGLMGKKKNLTLYSKLGWYHINTRIALLLKILSKYSVLWYNVWTL